MTTPATATARLSTIRLRHPVRHEAAHVIDLEAWADAARLVARHGRRVEIVHAVASTQTAPADEVTAHVARVAGGFLGEARRAHGAAWRWAGTAVAAFLAVAWFDAVTNLVSVVTATGGEVLAIVVAAIPAGLAAGKVVAEARRARSLGAVGRALALARVRRAAVLEEGGDDVAAFASECLSSLTELDGLVAQLPDAGTDTCARAAILALGIARAASRHGLAPVADAYHAIHVTLASAEASAAAAEHAGGMFAESRVRRTMRRAHGAIHASLSPFRVVGGVRTFPLAPAFGVVVALAIVGVTAAITGTFVVPNETAVIVDPPEARLARIAEAVGVDLSPLGFDGGTRTVVRIPGAQWSWPPPFADRRAVVLGDQFATVRSVVIQTGPDTFTVLQVRIRFRIVDLSRWARFDATGNGSARLGRGISAELQGRLEAVARDLLQRGAREPALAQNPRALARQVEQVMVMQLPGMLGQFAGTVNSFDIVAEAGVRVDPNFRQADVGLDRTATAATAGLGVGP